MKKLRITLIVMIAAAAMIFCGCAAKVAAEAGN